MISRLDRTRRSTDFRPIPCVGRTRRPSIDASRLFAPATLGLWVALSACSSGPVESDVGVFDAGTTMPPGVFRDASVRSDAQDSPPPPFPDASPPPDASSRDVGVESDAETIDAAADGGGLDADAAAFSTPSAYEERSVDDTILGVLGIEIVDIDMDGDRDLIAATGETDTIQLYVNGGNDMGGGNGSIWARVTVGTNIVGVQTTTGDFDGDADLDIAAVGAYDENARFASPGEVTWYRNPGDPTGLWTTEAITGLTFYGPASIRAGDLTGDQMDDLVVGRIEAFTSTSATTTDGQGLFWFRNTGGNFGAANLIDLQLGQVENIVLSDVDQNGVLDIILSSTGNGELRWYENMRTPPTPSDALSFAAHLIATRNRAYGLALENLDGDLGRELFATFDNNVGGAIRWYDPPTNPRDLWVESSVDETFGAGVIVRLAAADLNIDGRTDVAVASQPEGEVRAYYRAEDGGWIVRTATSGAAGVSSIAAGDIDGDGRPDLAISTSSRLGADRISWLRNVP